MTSEDKNDTLSIVGKIRNSLNSLEKLYFERVPGDIYSEEISYLISKLKEFVKNKEYEKSTSITLDRKLCLASRTAIIKYASYKEYDFGFKTYLNGDMTSLHKTIINFDKE